MMGVQELYDANVDVPDVDIESEYTPGERTTHEIGDSIRVDIDADRTPVMVSARVGDKFSLEDAIWRVVAWCRAYGVTGVYKEKLQLIYRGEYYMYRLGALYCVAGFEFTERESCYQKYGETPVDD